jgi:2-oxoglutarate ferredoxin oxidoreductase subunit beta
MSLPVTYEPALPIWCAGCGHFGVLNALETTLTDMAIPLDDVIVLAGIGCSGTIQNSVGAYGYHALHGRVLPAATGVALANPALTVIGASGDGDGYAIGVGHLVHAFRRNASFTYVLMNNQTYGLTKGQRSPSRLLDHDGASGWLDGPVLGVSIPTTTFVARGYSGWFEQLAKVMRQALEHARGGHGFAFIEVVSPCVTYEDTYPRWEQVLHNVDAEPLWETTDRAAALAGMATLSAEGRLPAGVLFCSPHAPAADRPSPAGQAIDPVALRDRYGELLARYAVAPAAH